MRIMSFIDEEDLIRKSLEHLKLRGSGRRLPPAFQSRQTSITSPFSDSNYRQTPGQGSGASGEADFHA